MKCITCLSFSLCASAVRLPTAPTRDASETIFPIEGTNSSENQGGDVIYPQEYVERLSKIYPEWDEPLPPLTTRELEMFEEPVKMNEAYHRHVYEYDNSTMCRMSMLDKLSSSQNKRVMLISPEDFNGKTFMKKLPSSGAVIFVSDHPTRSTCHSVRCSNPNFLDDPRILAVAAENSMCKHPKVGFLPIGFESKVQIGLKGSQALQTLRQWTQNPRPASQRKSNVQSDAQMHIFHHPLSGGRNDREDMKNGVQRSAIDDWYHSHIDFSSNIANHVSQAKLSLCPEGNGLDTHRFYHNYALRTRCIVRKGFLTELHSQFPGTIVVDDWHEVTAGNIKKWIEEGQATHDPKLLESDYWINKFLEPHGISLKI